MGRRKKDAQPLTIRFPRELYLYIRKESEKRHMDFVQLVIHYVDLGQKVEEKLNNHLIEAYAETKMDFKESKKDAAQEENQVAE